MVTHSMAPILMIMHLSIVYLHQREEEQEEKNRFVALFDTIFTNKTINTIYILIIL